MNRVTGVMCFQDGLNEVKGQRDRKILSVDLISFDNLLDEYEEFKDYTDPVFSDEIIEFFSTNDNTEERMRLFDEIKKS